VNANRPILVFCVLLNLRMLTELPRSLTLAGWGDYGDADYNRLMSAVFLLATVFLLSVKRHIKLPVKLQLAMLLAFFFLLIATANGVFTFLFIGMPISGVFVILLRFILEMLLVVFAFNFFSEPSRLHALYLYFFWPMVFCLTGLSFLQLLFGAPDLDRIMGPFGSPTTLALFLHLFIALAFFYFSEQRPFKFWILILVLIALLLYTGSIAVILANFFLIFLISRRERWIRSKKFYMLLPVFGLLSVSVVIYKWESILGRLSTIFNLESFKLARGSSLAWRLDSWKAYLSLLGDDVWRWIVGLGLGTQRYILHPAYENSLWRIFDAPGTHNDYLAVLVDFGLIGLLLFLIALRWLYVFIKKSEQFVPSIVYFRYYFLSVLLIIITENFVDQLIMFVFLTFLVAATRSAMSAKHPTVHQS
jgi:O-antigen ligase